MAGRPQAPPRPLRPDERTYRALLASLVGATLAVPVVQHGVSMALPYLADRSTPYTRAVGEVAAPVAHGVAIVAALTVGWVVTAMAMRAIIRLQRTDVDPATAVIPTRAAPRWCATWAVLTGAVPLVAWFAQDPWLGLRDGLAMAWPMLVVAATFVALGRWATPRLSR